MSDKKRILIIPSWYPPDGGYFFKEHSEAILQLGWEVDVLVCRLMGIRKLIQSGLSGLGNYRIFDEKGLRVARGTYLKWPGNEKINIEGWAARTLKLYRRYEKQFGAPDLILAHSVTWGGYAASKIRERSGVPYLIVEHRSFFVWSTEKARNMVRPYYLPFFEKAYRNCSKLVLVSESLKTGLKTLMPWIEEKITVIPNMIREDMFLPPPIPRRKDPFTFFWAGRLEHVKGLDLLLRSVKILKDQGIHKFEVRLAGKGSLRQELEQLSVELEVDQQVNFLGRISREEMQREMQGASCFVLPTRYEAFGAVLIEAMSTGLPVIATRSGGPDFIVNEENGVLIDTENKEQLAGAMQQLITDPDRYNGELIRNSTLEKYGHTRVMNRYGELFDQLI